MEPPQPEACKRVSHTETVTPALPITDLIVKALGKPARACFIRIDVFTDPFVSKSFCRDQHLSPSMVPLPKLT